MALSPAVPIMAPGELITSSRANAVRSNLDRIDNRITPEITAAINAATIALQNRQAQAGPFSNVVAGAPSDATTSSAFVTWLSIATAAPVPSWAVAAIITVHVGNVQALTADAVYALTATLNGGSYGGVDNGAIAFAASGNLASTSFVVTVPTGAIAGPGTLIGARRVSGTGQMRATATSRISASVSFR